MLKVAVIGGGSTYTPELVNGFLERVKQFPIDELWLIDMLETHRDHLPQFWKK
jgi:6-phospho-beta-glucosidase